MTHRDRAGDPPGRRKAAGDAGHRQGLPTPSGGSPARPERRFPKAFGRRPAWLAMPCIAAPCAPGRKPWETVSMGHYQRPLVLYQHPIPKVVDIAPPARRRLASKAPWRRRRGRWRRRQRRPASRTANRLGSWFASAGREAGKSPDASAPGGRRHARQSRSGLNRNMDLKQGRISLIPW